MSLPRRLAPAVLLAALSIFTCAAATATREQPPPHASQAKPAAALTLAETIAMALEHAPRLEAARLGVAAAQAERAAAAAWPNPELEAGIENVGGSGPYGSFGQAELTAGIAQELPVSGKIGARTALAAAGLGQAALDAEAARLDLIRDVTAAYMTVAAAEETVRLAAEQKAIAADVLRTVGALVRAAEVPAVQLSRFEVERASAALAFDKAERERADARRALATLTGAAGFETGVDTDAFYAITKPARLTNEATATLDSRRLDAAQQQAEARVALEQAKAYPDPRIRLGARQFEASGDHAFLLSLALPIPVLDTNSSNIEKARQEAHRTARDNQQRSLDLGAARFSAEARQLRAFVEADTLRSIVIPAAAKANQLVRDGYAAGQLSHLDVLDAQRSLFLARQQHIDAVHAYHTAKAAADRLAAAPPIEPVN